VTKVTLDVVPQYHVKQHVYTDLPVSDLERYFNDIFFLAYSVSLFTDWTNPKSVNQVRVKYVEDVKLPKVISKNIYGASWSTFHRHPVDGISAENCTDSIGNIGPWYDRIPHFKLGFTPSFGQELQSEYFVPRSFLLQNTYLAIP
jgi:xylitol oxidase